MQEPHPPAPEDFGVSGAEAAATPDFINPKREHGWTWLALTVLAASYGLFRVLPVNVADLAKNWPGYLFVGVFFVPGAGLGIGIVAYIVCVALDRILVLVWPTYARVNKFRAAQKRYQAQLAEYNAWLRRQAESFWRSLDGVSFERELGRLFQRMGFKVKITRHTGDGGVDLILEKSGERIVVQCKAHASKVGIGTARELVASMIDFRAHRGILAATSGVTKPVREYVKNRNIYVLDLDEILNLQRAHG